MITLITTGNTDVKLVQYGSKNCGPCKFAKDFIPIKFPNLTYVSVDMRDLIEGEDFHPSNYPIEIKKFPTFILVDKDNKYLMSLGSGFFGDRTRKVLANIKKALEDFSQLSQ